LGFGIEVTSERTETLWMKMIFELLIVIKN
jgi:hypothetical protein